MARQPPQGPLPVQRDDPDILRAQINKSYPQQKIGSKKEYGCYYKGARLLYTATVVRSRSGVAAAVAAVAVAVAEATAPSFRDAGARRQRRRLGSEVTP